MRDMIKAEDFEKNTEVFDVLRHEAIIIPENATNGDMIKAMFPSMNIQERNNVTLSIKGQTTEFTGMALREWWNAPYKAESKVISYMEVKHKGRK